MKFVEIPNVKFLSSDVKNELNTLNIVENKENVINFYGVCVL